MEGADNQSTGEQGREWDRICIRAIDHDSTGALLTKDNSNRMAIKKIRKIKEMRAKVSSN